MLLKKRLTLICLIQVLFWIIPGIVYSQKKDGNKLEQSIAIVLKKAYPACVQLFAYDTVARQQAGGVFSAVVVSEDGYMLTAAHVTTPGVVYKVTFPDGKTCLATGLGEIVLAKDKTIPDAAIIKIITPGSWPYAELGSSVALKVGEPCISLSYPESLGQLKPILRFGYVSEVKNDRGFIKSSCIMEPGDSGGPLFDYMGRVIGIHSAIEIPEESNYDVPVDVYKKYWTALKSEKIYKTYPDVEYNVPAGPSAAEIISSPGFVNNKSLKAIASKLSSTCIIVLSSVQGKLQTVNGTLFSIRGGAAAQDSHRSLILSKSSLVGAQPQIICADHHRVNVKIIARDKENDLILLEPADEIRGGISDKQLNAARLNKVKVGIFLVSPQQDTALIASTSGSAVFALHKMSSAGFMGVGFKSRTVPLKVSYVFPNLNKSIYQLNPGDEIFGINGQSAADFNGFLGLLDHFWPGDTIMVQLKRSDTSLNKAIVLDTLPQRHFNHPAEMFAGGKSGRRDGFTSVFTHDAILKPSRCGGPVFDLNGNFYGINIARFSRASCLSIPVAVVYNFINKSLSDQ